MNSSLSILAASSEELSAVKKLLPDVPAYKTGIGLVNAARGTEKILTEHSPRQVLFIGSCGVYQGQAELLEVVCSKSVALVDKAVLEDQAYFVADSARKIEARLLLEELKQLNFYSTLSITNSNSLSELYAHSGLHAENLELYSVATVCASHGVEWGAVSVVTNFIGEGAHQQWLENREEAASLTAQMLVKEINRFSC